MRTLASRRVALALVLLGAGLSLLAFRGPSASAQSSCEENGCVSAIDVTGLIDPILVRFIEGAIDDAEATPGVVGLVLQLDSPGVVVDDDEFARLARRLVDSEVPVSAWVGTGSEAKGGAAELLVVLDDTSMAPGSAMGEARRQRLPVDDVGDVFGDAGSRAIDGELSAGAAVDAGLVDRVEPTVGDHVVRLPGVKTEVVEADGESRRQLVSSVSIAKLDLTDQLFHTAASPSVAILALAIGVGLLIFEFFTAGVGVAGVVGAGALILAAYGLGTLPHRGWALALIVVASLAFLIDVQAGVPRFWTTLGVVAWVVGSVFLFVDVPRPWVALTVAIAGMAVGMISGMPAMVRARFGTPTIGRESMIGELGTAVSDVAPEGTVEIGGGRWRALTNRATPITAGDVVRVVAIDGLTLEIEPEEGGAVDYREMRGRRRGVGDSGAED